MCWMISSGFASGCKIKRTLMTMVIISKLTTTKTRKAKKWNYLILLALQALNITSLIKGIKAMMVTANTFLLMLINIMRRYRL